MPGQWNNFLYKLVSTPWTIFKDIIWRVSSYNPQPYEEDFAQSLKEREGIVVQITNAPIRIDSVKITDKGIIKFKYEPSDGRRIYQLIEEGNNQYSLAIAYESEKVEVIHGTWEEIKKIVKAQIRDLKTHNRISDIRDFTEIWGENDSKFMNLYDDLEEERIIKETHDKLGKLTSIEFDDKGLNKTIIFDGEDVRERFELYLRHVGPVLEETEGRIFSFRNALMVGALLLSPAGGVAMTENKAFEGMIHWKGTALNTVSEFSWRNVGNPFERKSYSQSIPEGMASNFIDLLKTTIRWDCGASLVVAEMNGNFALKSLAILNCIASSVYGNIPVPVLDNPIQDQPINPLQQYYYLMRTNTFDGGDGQLNYEALYLASWLNIQTTSIFTSIYNSTFEDQFINSVDVSECGPSICTFASNEKGKLYVLNTNIPDHPLVVDEISTPGEYAVATRSKKDAVFYLTTTGKLYAMDTTVASSTGIVGYVDVTGIPSGLAVEEDYAYVSCDYGFCIVDVSNLDTMFITYKADIKEYANGIAVDKNVLAVPFQTKVLLYDISDKSAPIKVGCIYPPSININSIPIGVKLKGSKAYIVYGEMGIIEYDISILSSPNPTRVINTGGFATALDLDNNENLHVAYWLGGHAIFSNNPTGFQKVGNFGNGTIVLDIKVMPSFPKYAVLAGYGNGLQIVYAELTLESLGTPPIDILEDIPIEIIAKNIEGNASCIYKLLRGSTYQSVESYSSELVPDSSLSSIYQSIVPYLSSYFLSSSIGSKKYSEDSSILLSDGSSEVVWSTYQSNGSSVIHVAYSSSNQHDYFKDFLNAFWNWLKNDWIYFAVAGGGLIVGIPAGMGIKTCITKCREKKRTRATSIKRVRGMAESTELTESKEKDRRDSFDGEVELKSIEVQPVYGGIP